MGQVTVAMTTWTVCSALDWTVRTIFSDHYLRQQHIPPHSSVYLETSQELPHHLGLRDPPHVVDLNVRLPQVGEEGEADALQVLQADVHVEDPGVLPLHAEIHGEGDAGLRVADLPDLKYYSNGPDIQL